MNRLPDKISGLLSNMFGIKYGSNFNERSVGIILGF